MQREKSKINFPSLSHSLFSLIFIFSLTSCDFFHVGVKEFFVKYTETAAIEKDVKSDSIGKSLSGIDCIESNEDKSIIFYLRNPQAYRLEFSYTFDHEEIAEHFDSYETDGTILYDQSADGSVMTMTFAHSFLHELEMGAIAEYDEDGNPTGKCIKDISGIIHIVESETRRVFESYHLELAVNSAPPRIRGAVIQRNKPSPAPSGETAYFVVCFNIKNLNNTVHQADTKDLYIGSELYHVDFSGGSIAITDEEGSSSNLKLSTTAPTSLYNVDGADTVFAAGTSAEGFVPLYYTTDINADSVTAANAVSYKIQLKDFDGFDTAVTVANVTDRLRPPQVNVNATSTEYAADDVTGTFDLVISHSGECYHNEEGVEVAGEPV
ncbi:MAG: hypothetical protein K6B17_00730, partial [Treponema sp.]|nr:hypothetical protein [Treponema sp.]